jgi:hypothetical protein
MTTAGFSNAGNNAASVPIANSPTVLAVTNATGVNETHAGTLTFWPQLENSSAIGNTVDFGNGGPTGAGIGTGAYDGGGPVYNIRFDGNNVTSFYISPTGYTGSSTCLQLLSSTAPGAPVSSGFEVTNTTCNNTIAGIVDGTSGLKINDITIHDNKVIQGTAAYRPAIDLPNKASQNVRAYNNVTSVTQTTQQLNGGATVDASGNISGNALISTVASGTPPLTVTSSTPVPNLSIGGNAATATSTAAVAGMTAGQVPVAGSSNTITGSKAVAGAGTALTTGPASGTTAGHLVTYADTAGTTQDSGVATSSLASASGMVAGQVAIAGGASSITSSKVLAGSGAGICTGPTNGITSGHLATFTGTTCQLQDGGALPVTTSPTVVIPSTAASASTGWVYAPTYTTPAAGWYRITATGYVSTAGTGGTFQVGTVCGTGSGAVASYGAIQGLQVIYPESTSSMVCYWPAGVAPWMIVSFNSPTGSPVVTYKMWIESMP